MNCASIRDPEEWFGYREARDGSTVFIRSNFMKLKEAGNVIMVLDEFNRLEPWLHNTLFPLLDDAGATTIHDETFCIGSGVIVVGTINTGYKYTGIFELDEAILNRFDHHLEVGPMPHREEVKVLTKRTGISEDFVNQIVKTANILRQKQIVCSTATTLRIARMVVNGMYVREAFEMAVIKRIPQDSSGSSLRKEVLDLVNVQLEPYKVRLLESDIFNLGQTEEEAEESGEVSRTKLTLTRNTSMTFLTVRIIKLLRQLSIVDSEPFSLREAKSMVDSIENGDYFSCYLEPDSPTFMSDFEQSGLHVKLEQI
jgi:hypothetical protein